ncbi:hypothetical protein IQ07DRAFT_603583 [Pyrenochaeta sp. DS3sAY3a]|nr:hypothetical protein IQ07DRAFT_603583 [Pyrenochaeta sp. DS3sAY3a]
MDPSHSHSEPPAPPPDNHFVHHIDHDPVHNTHEHHDHHRHHHSPPHDSPPNYPPPPYEEGPPETNPLLIGQPPDYGAFDRFSSQASSEIQETERSLPESAGQMIVVFVFVAIIYAFYRVINAPDDLNGFPG